MVKAKRRRYQEIKKSSRGSILPDREVRRHSKAFGAQSHER